MTCEHCGRKTPDNALICPSCGTVSAGIPANPTTTYGTYPPDGYNDFPGDAPAPTYDQGYAGSTAGAGFSEAPAQDAHETRYYPPPAYQARPAQGTSQSYTAAHTTSSGALIAEILCSLFGVYGVGWYMAGEKKIGTVLLVCSFVVIWPLAIFIAIITFGLGIPLCDLPLAITAIIVNAILLNNSLNRKASPPIYHGSPLEQSQAARMPPQQMPPQ